MDSTPEKQKTPPEGGGTPTWADLMRWHTEQMIARARANPPTPEQAWENLVHYLLNMPPDDS